MDKDNGNMIDEMKNLRTKTSKDEVVTPFKKNLFGGVKEKEVEEYIASITQQFNRAEEAYKDRIDEFTTQTEMLSKECDDIQKQLKTRTDELEDLQKALLSVTNEKSVLQKRIEESQSRIAEMETCESERILQEKPAADLIKEKDYLKEELYEIQRSRDQLAGENAVIKKQLKDTDDLLTIANKEKSDLLEEAALIRSALRQDEMRKSLVFCEYSEKQHYAMNQTTNKMRDMIACIEEMKADLSLLQDSWKENPLS